MIHDFIKPIREVYKSKNPDFEKLVRKKLEGQHFMKHIGFDLSKIEEGYIEGEAEVKPFMAQQDGILHGGVISTVGDIVCGFSAFSLVSADTRVVTGELKVSYLNPGKGERILAKGYVVKPGKRLFFCEGEVWVQRKNEKYLCARIYTTMTAFKVGNPDE